MNHVYRLVWSHARNMLVAVAEIAGAHSKGSSPRLRRAIRLPVLSPVARAVLLALWLSPGLAPSLAFALPSGGQVVAGQASIHQSGSTLTVNQGSAKAVVNWQGFGIGADETVNFRQPGTDSVALNRVMGNNASDIYGHLNANGQVFLVNPNGIYFAPGAQVNVGGIVASTLDISNQDFLDGNYRFSGSSTASVDNAGSITTPQGGYVAFIGNQVSNNGSITTPGGTTALGAGSSVTLTLAGNSLVSFQVSQAALDAQVANGGAIMADGGKVILSAQAKDALLKTVVNNTGLIQAQTVQAHDGVIELLGGDSGTTQVAGTLDASAPTATNPEGGNGGHIETSGAHLKVADGATITTKSANGKDGSWLIDPSDLTVAASGGDITGSALTASLGTGNVTIQTSSLGSGNGDIFVNDSVSWSVNTLTLNAYRNIEINQTLNGSGTAGLALQYGQGAVAAGNTATYNVNAPVNLAATGSFSTKLGSDGSTVNWTIITSLGAQGSTTATDLQGIRGNLSGHYVLGADIDAVATSTNAAWNAAGGFLPIGTNVLSNKFTGIFDGLHHTISDLYSSHTNYAGLFGIVAQTGTVRNVGTVGGSVHLTGEGVVGGLTALNQGTISNAYATGSVSITGTNSSNSNEGGGLAGANIGTISNAYATGSVSVNGSGSGVSFVGGLVGYSTAGTIRNAHATGSVSGDVCGGLVGKSEFYGTISNAYATGNVSGSGIHTGGLVGWSRDSTIANSHATGSVSGGSDVGGLVGDSTNTTYSNVFATGTVSGTHTVGGLVGGVSGGSIQNAYATGSVSAQYLLGGLVGWASSTMISNAYASGTVTGNDYLGASDWVGGLIGWNTDSTISNAYATGSVSGRSRVGGLVGQLGSSNNSNITGGLGYSAGTITNAYATGGVSGTGSNVGGLVGAYYHGTVSNGYWDIDTTGQATSAGGGSGIHTSNAFNQATYSGFDFTNTWWLSAGNTRPILRSEYSTSIANGHQLQLSALDLGASYTLANDIDLGELQNASGVWNTTSGFVPIGSNSTNAFTGTFDGLGHTISGLTINRQSSNNEGLFGYASNSAIRNVGLVGGSVKGGEFVGALVGYGDSTTINNAYATSSVQGAGRFVGGLVGANAYGTISNAYATGSVSGGSNTGGLVGSNYGTIHNAYATGSVSGSGSNVGGLVGNNDSNGAIYNAYATGSVNGSNIVGGLVGLNNGSLSNAYATGSVSGTNVVGGLVGSNSNGTITNGYWDTTTTGLAGGIGGNTGGTITGGGGLNDTDMHLQASFTGFDFSSPVWVIYDGHTTPLLDIFLTPLQVTADNLTQTYTGSGSTLTLGNPSYSVSGADTSGHLLGLTSPYGNAVHVGTYTADLWSDQQGYRISLSGGQLSITAKALSLVGLTASDKVYDGTTAATVTSYGSLSGIVSGDTVTLDSSSATANFADQHVGSGKTVTVASLGLSGASASDYSLASSSTTTASITAKALSLVGLTASDKVYDGTTAATVTSYGSLSGIVGSDSVSLNSSSATANFADQHVGSGKTVTVASLGLSGTSASDYSIADQTTTASITAKALSLLGLSASDKVYDGTTVATVISYGSLSGIVSGDTVTLDSSSATANFADQHVASGKTVTVASLGLSGSNASDYSLLSSWATTASITPKVLSLAGLSASDKVYDGTTAATVTSYGSLSGIVGSDSVTLVTSAATANFADQHVGSGKTVTVASLGLSGASASDYSIADQATTASITPKALSLSGLSASDKVYDGTTVATVASYGNLSGIVGSDSVSLDNSSATANFADQHVATGKTVTVASLGLSGASASDYSLASSWTTTASITTKVLSLLSLTASDKVYDGITAATVTSYGSLSGIVSGDTVTLDSSSATANFADQHVGSGKTVTVASLGLSGASASDYSIADQATTASITAKALSLSGLTASDKVYDGTTAATVTSYGSLSGIVGSDSVSLDSSSATANFADQHVGSGKTVTVASLGLSGASASDYSIADQATTASIMAKALSLVGLTASDKVYDGTTAATVTSYGSLSGIVSGDTVTVDSSSAAANFADQHVGTGKTVTVASLGLSGASASDYSLASSWTTTATITAKALSLLGLSASDKVYDGTTVATVISYGSLSGIVGSDSVSLDNSSATANFADQHVGSGKTVTVASLGLSGSSASDYSIGDQTTTASITPLALSLVGLTASDRVYDGTTAATISSYGSLSGAVSGDTVTLDSSSATANFADQHVGSGKTVTVASLGLSGASASDYSLASSSTTTASITAKVLSLVGLTASDKVYDGTTAATVTSYGSLSGIVGSDSVSLDSSGATANFADQHVGSGKTVTVASLGLSGGSASDYSLVSSWTTTATITPKALSLSGLSASDKVYDGTTAATVTGYGSLSGIVGSDSISLDNSSATANFADQHVATAKTVTVASLGLRGASASDYSIADQTTTASITPKAVTGSIIGNPTKLYDGTTAANLQPGNYQLTGFVDGEGATVTQVAGSYASPMVGTGIPVTTTLAVGDYQASGGTRLGDYTLPTLLSGTGSILDLPSLFSVLGTAEVLLDGGYPVPVSGTSFVLFPVSLAARASGPSGLRYVSVQIHQGGVNAPGIGCVGGASVGTFGAAASSLCGTAFGGQDNDNGR